jgi:hypothetical protein
MTAWHAVAPVGLILVCLNVRGTLRVWRSAAYEQAQKLAQTGLIWLIPGAVFAVTYILRDDRPGPAPDDATARNPETPNGSAVTGAGSASL